MRAHTKGAAMVGGPRVVARALYGAALSIPGEHFVRCVVQLFADVAGLCALASRRLGEQDR